MARTSTRRSGRGTWVLYHGGLVRRQHALLHTAAAAPALGCAPQHTRSYPRASRRGGSYCFATAAYLLQ
jgi:hypothetical protein